MMDTNISKEHAAFIFQLPPKRGHLPTKLYNVTTQKTTVPIIKTSRLISNNNNNNNIKINLLRIKSYTFVIRANKSNTKVELRSQEL
jgi:hypothetical protein